MERLILAPMVRGSFPAMRTFMLQHGADLVYTDVIMAKAVLDSRVEKGEDAVVFSRANQLVARLRPAEAAKTVIYLAATTAAELNAAAALIAPYCVRIDLNLGCGKHFTHQCGAGGVLAQKQAALLELLDGLSPDYRWSAKTRLFATPQQTAAHLLQLLQRCERVAVHARYFADDREKSRARAGEFFAAVKLLPAEMHHRVFYNGDIFRPEDHARFIRECAYQHLPPFGVMIARGALRNVHVFSQIRDKAKESVDIQQYVELGNLTLASGSRTSDFKAVVMFGLKLIKTASGLPKELRNAARLCIAEVAPLNDCRAIIASLQRQREDDL